MSRDDETFEIDGVAEAETDLAICVFDGERSVWLPKQFVTDNGNGTFTIPAWLAEQKGFV